MLRFLDNTRCFVMLLYRYCCTGITAIILMSENQVRNVDVKTIVVSQTESVFDKSHL